MDVGTAFVADAKATVLMRPTQRSLHDPAGLPKPAAVRLPTLRDHRLDSASPEFRRMRARVVRPVGLDARRSVTRPAAPALERRDAVD